MKISDKEKRGPATTNERAFTHERASRPTPNSPLNLNDLMAAAEGYRVI